MSSNPAFAFVVNSLLSNNKNVKILSKAKKENISITSNSNKNNKVDLVDKEGRIIDAEKINSKIPDLNKKLSKSTQKEEINKKEISSKYLSKPENEDKEKEKRLTLIATKGVVKLFNIVGEKQRVLKRKLNEAGSSESKRVKVLTEFSENELQEKSKNRNVKNNRVSKKRWSVLEEDFMTGAKLKDWDKESDSDS